MIASGTNWIKTVRADKGVAAPPGSIATHELVLVADLKRLGCYTSDRVQTRNAMAIVVPSKHQHDTMKVPMRVRGDT